MTEPHCAAGWSPCFANAGAHGALDEALTHTHILSKLCNHKDHHRALSDCSCDCMAILSSHPFSVPRLCCQMTGLASGWESQIPRRSLSPCKYPSPLTNYSWTASVLTVLITSGWHVPVARAPHPGPTGFPWRRLREVRRGWWGRLCPLPPGPCLHQCHPQHLLSPIYPMWPPSPSCSVPTPQHSTGISPGPLPYASAPGRPA